MCVCVCVCVKCYLVEAQVQLDRPVMSVRGRKEGCEQSASCLPFLLMEKEKEKEKEKKEKEKNKP